MYLVDTFGQSVRTTSTRIESEHADFHVANHFLREPKGCFLHFYGEILGEKTARNRKRAICDLKRTRVNKGWLMPLCGEGSCYLPIPEIFLPYFEYFLNILLKPPGEEFERLLKEQDNLCRRMGFWLTYCFKRCLRYLAFLGDWCRFVVEDGLVMEFLLVWNVSK